MQDENGVTVVPSVIDAVNVNPIEGNYDPVLEVWGIGEVGGANCIYEALKDAQKAKLREFYPEFIDTVDEAGRDDNYTARINTRGVRMTSKIDICSNALQLVGDNPISSFTESGSAALAENLYDQFYESQLSYHPWGFALKQQKLNLLTEKPDTMTNYSNAFQLPTDLVFLWNIQPFSRYEIIGDLLYSNTAISF